MPRKEKNQRQKVKEDIFDLSLNESEICDRLREKHKETKIIKEEHNRRGGCMGGVECRGKEKKIGELKKRQKMKKE